MRWGPLRTAARTAALAALLAGTAATGARAQECKPACTEKTVVRRTQYPVQELDVYLLTHDDTLRMGALSTRHPNAYRHVHALPVGRHIDRTDAVLTDSGALRIVPIRAGHRIAIEVPREHHLRSSLPTQRVLSTLNATRVWIYDAQALYDAAGRRSQADLDVRTAPFIVQRVPEACAPRCKGDAIEAHILLRPEGAPREAKEKDAYEPREAKEKDERGPRARWALSVTPYAASEQGMIDPVKHQRIDAERELFGVTASLRYAGQLFLAADATTESGTAIQDHPAHSIESATSGSDVSATLLLTRPTGFGVHARAVRRTSGYERFPADRAGLQFSERARTFAAVYGVSTSGLTITAGLGRFLFERAFERADYDGLAFHQHPAFRLPREHQRAWGGVASVYVQRPSFRIDASGFVYAGDERDGYGGRIDGRFALLHGPGVHAELLLGGAVAHDELHVPGGVDVTDNLRLQAGVGIGFGSGVKREEKRKAHP